MVRLNRPAILSVALLGFLILFPIQAWAAPSFDKFLSNKIITPFSFYGDLGNCWTSCLRLGTGVIGGFNDKTTFTRQWANYTNFAFGASANPAQSFAVANNRMNTSLNVISTNGIEFQVAGVTTFTAGMPSITVFTVAMHVQTSKLIAPEVDVTVGGLKTQIQQSSYINNAANFASCQVPCVFGNSGNRTVVVRIASTLPETVDILFSVPISITPVTSPDYSGYIALLLLPLILILFLKRRGQPENVRSQ